MMSNNDLVKVSFEKIYVPRIGISVLLCVEIVNFISKISQIHMSNEIYDFFKEPNNYIGCRNEKEVVEKFVLNVFPMFGIGVQSEILSGFEEREFENYDINIKNLQFFLKNLWPVLLKKIIEKNITIIEFKNLEKKLDCRIRLSEKTILSKYPEGISVEDAEKEFLEDLDKWLYYNFYYVEKTVEKLDDNYLIWIN